jgi:hypothetical protein
MIQFQPQSRGADLPRVVRIPPNRSALWLVLGAGATLFGALVLLRSASAGPVAHLAWGGRWYWAALVLCALIVIAAALRLLAQLPFIEASELGIAVWLYGPYQRPFFVPWTRVRAVVLTRVRRAGSARRARPRKALGIELIQDGQFRLPQLAPDHETPVDGAARADVAWSRRRIGGDPRRWAELLQRMRSACREPGP